MSIIDHHLSWCGPCNVIEPNFRLMYFNIEDASLRLEFLTASEEVMPEGLAQKLELSCKPRFLIYKNGKKEAEIDGVKLTEIEAKVIDLLPALDD